MNTFFPGLPGRHGSSATVIRPDLVATDLWTKPHLAQQKVLPMPSFMVT